MNLYVETSGLVSVLFNESRSQEVVEAINRANSVVTSILTLIEAKRACARFPEKGAISGFLENLVAKWALVPIDEIIQEIAAKPFPVEPVRTLDAIHLATALECFKVYPDLSVLTLDKRILSNLEALGLSAINIP